MAISNQWKVLRKKPLWVIEQEAQKHELKATYGFLSLLAIGVGGTVGSGIFVLNGRVASSIAGPSSVLSWLVAGFVCLLTAIAFCELSVRIPATGSTYSFSYHSIGEIVGVVAGWLLFLEYGISSASVARAWGDKVAFWLVTTNNGGCSEEAGCWFNSLGGTPVNIGATMIQIACILVLLVNADFGKNFINILVGIKVTLVTFVIIVGFVYFDADNLNPFIPDPSSTVVGGVEGIFQGSAIAFMGYIGFDEVTCLAMEAKNPKRDVPAAIGATVIVISVLYALASLSLVGMIPFELISPEDGFYSAFNYVGASWAADIVIAGEVFVVLPTVVLISLVPQIRLQYALSKDGMLPRIFSVINSRDILLKGTIIGGTVCVLVATFVPFNTINDLISAGILFSFILSNMSLILLRAEIRLKDLEAEQVRDSAENKNCLSLAPLYKVHRIIWVGLYVAFSAAVAYSWLRAEIIGLTIFFACCNVLALLMMYILYFHNFQQPEDERPSFYVPLMPLLPALAIQINWLLFVLIGPTGDWSVLALIAISIVSYFMYGFRKSVGRITNEWDPITISDMADKESESDIPLEGPEKTETNKMVAV